MIHLITGVPGAGKTLYALWCAKKLCDAENRPLFVMGVEDLIIAHEQVPAVADWTELAPSEEDPSVMVPHFTFPVGAVILVDECQKVYRPRAASVKVPDCVAAFETHRHEGLDFFLVTQHPLLLDGNVRRLVGRHTHVMRKFGSHSVNLHEWPQCRDNPDKNRRDSDKRSWRYPKEVFTWYKSAELHTHKLHIPAMVWKLLSFVVLLGLCVWGFYGWADRQMHPHGTPQSADAKAENSGSQGEPVGGGSGGSAPKRQTVQEYLADQDPRIEGLAYTAPVYDDVTKPVEAPYPATCMVHGPKCGCWSQQGTKLEMADSLCRNIVKTGIYLAWQSSQPQQPVQAVPQSVPSQQDQPSGPSQLPQSLPARPEVVHNAAPGGRPGPAWPAAVAKS